jgi:hypothetical protein
MGSPPSAPPQAPTRRARALPAVLVLLIILFVAFGGFVAAGALSQPSGPPVTVSGVLRVSALSGWALSERFPDPPGPAGVRLTRGSGNLDVVEVPFAGDALQLARWYVDRILEPTADRLSVSPEVTRVRLRSGLEAARIHYVGLFGRGEVPVEGEITAVVSASSVGAVFDAWAPQGLLQFVVGDTRAMAESAEVS